MRFAASLARRAGRANAWSLTNGFQKGYYFYRAVPCKPLYEKETMGPRERRLLGEILIEMGFASSQQVQEAWRTQTEDYRSGLLGEILMEMGAVNLEQIVEALRKQEELPDDPGTLPFRSRSDSPRNGEDRPGKYAD